MEETKELLLSSTKLNYEKKYFERLQKKMKNNKEQSITTTQSSIINEKENWIVVKSILILVISSIKYFGTKNEPSIKILRLSFIIVN